MWWQAERFSTKSRHLETRMAVIRAMRSWFEDQGFWEVETPALQVSPGMEAHLRAMRTEITNATQDRVDTLFLHTSPEFAMKKLLVAGLPKIFQICHCYRNAEGSRLHSPEFTMLEWYRARSGYREIMDDCVSLLRACARGANVLEFRHRDVIANPFSEWERISVCDAFRHYAAIDIEPLLDDTRAMRAAAIARGLHTSDDDSWDDLFFRIFLEFIEPRLGFGRPTILFDYPVSMAALSRPKPEDPRFAERFEVYVCGLELANAFGELTDAKVQRERFEADLRLKEQLYGEIWPVDRGFIAALEEGMPEAGGIALGVDRLAMLASGADDIDQVLWCGRPGADAPQ